LGYMSFTTGLPVEEVVKESIGLAFVTYPKAISLMPGFANIFGVFVFCDIGDCWVVECDFIGRSFCFRCD